jgi:hypothetical protein
MSGGSSGGGGGGGGGKKNKTQPAVPAAPGNMMLNTPAFMPGNQGALASQLSMGFGGTPESFMQSPLMNLFQPMNIPNYPGGAPLIPAPVDTKKKKK